jgi:hypothetical protein
VLFPNKFQNIYELFPLCVEVGVDIVTSPGLILDNLETMPCTNHSHFELVEKKFLPIILHEVLRKSNLIDRSYLWYPEQFFVWFQPFYLILQTFG